jgi:ribokinase
MDVVVVGSVNRDYVCRVEALPAPGETLLGGEASIGSGGKGGNQAVAASLLGARTALVARTGDDDDGRALLADLAAAGVDTGEVVALPDVRTGMAFVMVDTAGENSIVVAPGANERLEPGPTAHAVHRLLGPSGVMVTQAEIPGLALEAAVLAATSVGARAVVNLAPFRPVPPGVLALCDPLVVNESEVSGLLGREVRGTAGARAAVAELRGRVRSVVVTVGAAGAVRGGRARGHDRCGRCVHRCPGRGPECGPGPGRGRPDRGRGRDVRRGTAGGAGVLPERLGPRTRTTAQTRVSSIDPGQATP